MKVDVTYDAPLRALIEAIRDARNPGKALMRVLSRLMGEAGQEGWLTNGAEQMKKKRATRWAKPAGTARATSRTVGPAAKPTAARKANGSTQATKKRATAKSAAARKVNGSAQVTKRSTPARMTKSAATSKSASRTTARPMASSATAREANGAIQASEKRMTSRPTKPASAAKFMPKSKLAAKTAPRASGRTRVRRAGSP